MAHTWLRRRNREQCHRHQLCLIEQASAQLAPPFEHHICIQAILQSQLRDRHAGLASLLRQLALEIQRIVLAVFNFTLQKDGPHQILAGTILA